MKLSEAKIKGYFELFIDLAGIYPGFAPGDLMLTFREPTEDESLAIMKARKDPERGIAITARLWVELLEDWTLEDETGEKLDKKSVIDYLASMSGATTFINKELWSKLPLALVTGTDSAKSPVSSSEEKV